VKKRGEQGAKCLTGQDKRETEENNSRFHIIIECFGLEGTL